MKLPNANKAVVVPEKIADYLLNPVHPDNGGKAEFFTRLGFHRNQWETLASTLQALAQTAEVTRVTESPHGKKYVIIGQIESPSGETAQVQTIWIVDKGLNVARLVTAYPRKF
jgi:hypothetical protein